MPASGDATCLRVSLSARVPRHRCGNGVRCAWLGFVGGAVVRSGVRNEVRSEPLDCQYPSLGLSKDQMGNGEEGAMPGAADEMPLGDQGLSWSWGLDFDALMAALNEPAPWNRPAPAAPATATASAPDADDSESD